MSEMLRQGWTINGSSDQITIRNDTFELDFDEKIQKVKGVLYGINIFGQKGFCGVAENAMTHKNQLHGNT
jgi:hypothetical protein